MARHARRTQRRKPPYDSVADFTPVVFVGWSSLLLVVHPSVAVKTVGELIAHARANPGKLIVAAANPPTIFTMAQIKTAGKVEMLDVAYKGDAAALPDLLAGRVHVLSGGTNLLLPYVKEGRLRALAALTRTRTRPAPDIPTIVEAGVPNFSIYGWFAFFAPVKTSIAIVERLERDIGAVLSRPETQPQFDKIGLETGGPTRQELPAFVKSQIASWAVAARDAGLENSESPPTGRAAHVRRFEAIIFDMDGLLLDTERIALSAFRATCDQMGVRAQADLFLRCIGTNQALGREVLKAGLQDQVDYLIFEQVWDSKYVELTSDRPVPLKDGAVELLEHIASMGIPAAVATSTRTTRALDKLKRCGILDRFHTIVGGDQVPNGKPAPDIYLKAAGTLGAPAGKCLALEDSENGVRAAVSAGMTVVQVPDLVEPSRDLLALGHIVLGSLREVATYPFGRVAQVDCSEP